MAKERLLNKSMLTIKAVARRLNVSDKLIYKMIAERKIRFVKINNAYRILESDLEDYIREHYHSEPEEE